MRLVTTNSQLDDFFLKNFVRYNFKETLTSDNWPFFYLQHRQIPSMYLLVMGLISAMLLFMRFVYWKKTERIHWHFFFLGAAFLLLEFQNINKTALLFGATWIVNAINISAILVMVLLANLFVTRWSVKNLLFPYLGLGVSLLIVWAVPLSVFAALPFWAKLLCSSFVLNLPIFFSGIIFATSFKNFPNKNIAFGSNLLGAVVGGMLEHLAFLTGIRFLVLVTLVLYVLSFLTIEKRNSIGSD